MTHVTPEFSRPVSVANLRDGEPESHVVSASATERDALARRFDLLAMPRLEATATVVRLADVFRVDVVFTAEVVQACVVTLDPVSATVTDRATVTFARELPPPAAGDVFVDPDAEDPPDPLVGDAIDLGEVIAEHVGLALDPYPRRPGAVFGVVAEGEEGEGANPFAVLRRLKH